MQDFINDTLIQETLDHAKNPDKSRVMGSSKRQRGFMDFLSRKRQHYSSVRTMTS